MPTVAVFLGPEEREMDYQNTGRWAFTHVTTMTATMAMNPSAASNNNTGATMGLPLLQ